MPRSEKKLSPPAISLSIAQAKAGFSSLIHEVEERRNPVTILRRGVPVAQVIPLPDAEPDPFLGGSMLGTGKITGDIVTSFLEEWTVDEDRTAGDR